MNASDRAAQAGLGMLWWGPSIARKKAKEALRFKEKPASIHPEQVRSYVLIDAQPWQLSCG